MKIVYISEFYAPTMSYVENNLPRNFAALGHEVHLIATKKSPFLNMVPKPVTDEEYANNLKSLSVHHGVNIHFLEHKEIFGIVHMIGLGKKISELKPDIVQITAPYSIIPSVTFFTKFFTKFKLFSMAHHTVSSFPVAQRVPQKYDWTYFKSVFPRWINGRIISLVTEKCFAATTDCAYVAHEYFGVQKQKIILTPLCVDTVKCYANATKQDYDERQKIREDLNYLEGDIVCIYTGKFIEDKNPLILAQAIGEIAKTDSRFKGLFIGSGPQEDSILKHKNCKVIPFLPSDQLPKYYRATDIGVWPKQESVSMIEAAACGIPIVVNHTLQAVERIDGNGLTFELENLQSLIEVLISLKDIESRNKLGINGANKAKDIFDWKKSAELRISYFQKSLN